MTLPFYKTNTIHSAYLNQESNILSFFKYSLRNDWLNLSKKVNANYDNVGIIEELIRQNLPANSPSIEKNLAKLQSGKTVIVITGQQLGLMISPLYTVYKILTAIKLARKIEAQNQSLRVVPVFWLEGEDHDYQEINHARFWDKNGEICTLSLDEKQEEESRSISKRTLSEGINIILKQLDDGLAETVHSSEFLKKLHDFYQPGTFWLKAFKDQLLDIFSSFGLLTFNPTDAKVKKLSRPFFKNIIENNHSLMSDFKSSSDGLIDSGFFNQVKVLADRSFLFYNHEGEIRQPLLINNNQYKIKNPDKLFSKKELLVQLEHHPEWFSSSVLTRPLWQSWMLPVISYVAGPGEIAYWAQLRKAFNRLNIEMPHLQPRLTVTLVDARRARLIKKYNIDLSQIHGSRQQFIRSQITASLFTKTSGTFSRLEEQLNQYKRDLIEEAGQIDPTLEPVASKSFGSIDQILKKLQNRLIKRLEEREVLMKGHLESIYDFILPGGSLQERTIGSLFFLNAYGPEWIRIMDDELDVDEPSHQVVVL